MREREREREAMIIRYLSVTKYGSARSSETVSLSLLPVRGGRANYYIVTSNLGISIK